MHKFFGGVCPAPRKELTRRKPIGKLSAQPDLVYIPLSDGCGGYAKPLVKPGSQVHIGQPISAASGDGVGAHASVSGRVVAIESHPSSWGGAIPVITIQNNGRDVPWPGHPAPLDPGDITLELLLERISESGITDMGGGPRCLLQTLRAAAGRASTLIINAAESEPYVSADHRLLLERSEHILNGARIVARCLRATRTVLVTEGDKLNAAELLEHRLRRHKQHIELITIRTRYPLGAERQLVQTVTGQELGRGVSPLDVGCVILGPATLYAIECALLQGIPLTHRAVTVSGGALCRPRNIWVPLGTPLRHLLYEADGLREESALLLTGGVMRGRPVEELDGPVLPDTSCLIALGKYERKAETATTCIRCGKCVSVCPMHLAPVFIARALREGDTARLAGLRPEDCISCGCCSFACPANLPLVELVAEAKYRAAGEEGKAI